MFHSKKQTKSGISKSLISEKNYLEVKEQQKLELNNDKENSTLNLSNQKNKSKVKKDGETSEIETFSNQCCPCCGDILLNCIREK